MGKIREGFRILIFHMPAMVMLVCVMILLTGAWPVNAAEYYLSPEGDDQDPGTLEKPWKTIKKANAALQGGDTVFLRKGLYHEKIQPANSGTEDGAITFKNYLREKVTITGKHGNAVYLERVDYITIEGLYFDGLDRIFCAIYINDHGDHITIRECVIRNYRNAKNTGGYGIWVDGDGASHLLVENCMIYHCGTDNPDIENGSNIHIFKNSDNIIIRGCDIYESYTEDGLHLGAFGLVTDVLVENSRFWGCKEDGIDMKHVERVTVRNCEFWGHRNSPTGGGAGIVIHIGANTVTVDRCRFHDNRGGVGISYNASEEGGKAPPTQNIRVQRSVFYNNKIGILVVGGLHTGPALGKLKDVGLYNNVFFANEYGIELYAHEGGDAVSIEVKNNIFAQNTKSDLTVYRDRIRKLVLDSNNYPDGVTKKTFEWFEGKMYNFEEFRKLTGYEKNGMSLDPGFINTNKLNFHLSADSPMIDQGIDVGLAFDGKGIDMGAHEHEGEGR